MLHFFPMMHSVALCSPKTHDYEVLLALFKASAVFKGATWRYGDQWSHRARDEENAGERRGGAIQG